MSTPISSAARADQQTHSGRATALPTDTAHDTERAKLTSGLLAQPARVAPKYLYDTLGSKLFEALCLLPEYYPTRTEAAIVCEHLDEIADAAGPYGTLIDLGAGNCAKAERLFDALKPDHYVAVDISADFLHTALNRLRASHPNIHMTALGQDFSHGLQLPDTVPANGRLFFYPGSSLGNFAPPDACRFLGDLRQNGGDDSALLLGVDLVKDAKVLNAAYDDELGVTSAFNLNLLRHVNRTLHANFDVRDWRHVSFFNETESRVEMHLQARRSVDVCWENTRRHFDEGERIHTENSYKYTRASLNKLLQQAGWHPSVYWTDEDDKFAVVHAQASLPAPRGQGARA
ncbi:MAG TPA: L-histidine N(alpha)-methyltransferase [Pusillimonas sp.]|uniref:L-histidine N(alpha)-methyltransferase n=1 Tax=Pusillimonas sp. TaxID=3040095 RepID=UPI002BF22EF5|nr:L-histidine N(alpha)-methyltransferase [Pusillimonas sp.]HUH87910.1 L-histidine N(alpha)-methyltransferase [Pusillimonas sp.]